MKPETDNPYRVGTRIIVVYAPAARHCIGATGEIVAEYQWNIGAGHWGYGVLLDRHPPPFGPCWHAAHRNVRPLCPPDPIADDVPAQKGAVA